MSSLEARKNIVVSIIAQNENQALQGSSEGFGGHLEARGYRHRILDMLKPSAAGELKALLQDGEVAFAYGIAGVGSRLSLMNGTNLWTAHKTPFVSLWYDHPAYNFRQHIVDSPYVVQAYHVLDHLEMRNKHLPPSTSSAIMLPLRFGAGYVGHLPFNQRQPKILYAKSGKDPEAFAEDWKRHPPVIQKILHDLTEHALKNRDLDLTAAAKTLFDAQGLTLSDLDLLMGVIAEVDGYIRAWRSDRLAHALLNFPAHIIGGGWDYLKSGATKAEFLPPIPFHDYTRKLSEYRIIANTNPLWRDGIHERACHAAVMGNIVLTDRTVKSETYFHGLLNYIAFEWDDDLADVISTALRLSENENADYVPTAQAAMHDRVLTHTPDYIVEIEKAVNMVRT